MAAEYIQLMHHLLAYIHTYIHMHHLHSLAKRQQLLSDVSGLIQVTNLQVVLVAPLGGVARLHPFIVAPHQGEVVPCASTYRHHSETSNMHTYTWLILRSTTPCMHTYIQLLAEKYFRINENPQLVTAYIYLHHLWYKYFRKPNLRRPWQSSTWPRQHGLLCLSAGRKPTSPLTASKPPSVSLRSSCETQSTVHYIIILYNTTVSLAVCLTNFFL